MAGLLVDEKRYTAQSAADMILLDGVHTELPIHKTASENRAPNYLKEHEKMYNTQVVVDSKLAMQSAETRTKIGQLQTAFGIQKKRHE